MVGVPVTVAEFSARVPDDGMLIEPDAPIVMEGNVCPLLQVGVPDTMEVPRARVPALATVRPALKLGLPVTLTPLSPRVDALTVMVPLNEFSVREPAVVVMPPLAFMTEEAERLSVERPPVIDAPPEAI
jgi:hypothetical protein